MSVFSLLNFIRSISAQYERNNEGNGNISEGTETCSSEGNAFQKMKVLRIGNPKKIIISYININSVRNKFHDVVSLLQDSVDILVIAETKLDSSFLTSQFMIPGYKKPD